MALTDNAVSYWKLDESSGGAADSVGSNTLTNVNTVTYASGKINNGVSIDRINLRYLMISDAGQSGLDLGLSSTNFSISFWVKMGANPGAGEYHPFICKYDQSVAISDTTAQYGVWYDNDGAYRLNFMIRGTGSTKTAIYNNGSTPIFTVDTWYYVTCVFISATSIKIYINGNSTAVASNTTDIPASLVNTTKNFDIGTDSSGTNVGNCMIDEVYILDRDLSTSEMSQLYNSGSGWQWPFSNTYSRTLSDSMMNSVDRLASIGTFVVHPRTASDSMMNSAARLASVSRGLVFPRSFSESMMNSAARLATLSTEELPLWTTENKVTTVWTNE